MTGKANERNGLHNTSEITVQAVTPFTDKQLFDLYGKLKDSYHSAETMQANFDRMSLDLFAEFLPGGIYAGMNENDQKKIYTVFTTFLNAQSSSAPRTSAARSFEPFDSAFQRYARSHYSMPNTYVIHHHHHYQQANWFNDYLFWHWALSDSSSHHHQSNDDCLKLVLMLIVAAIAAVVLYFAACYLFTAIAESLERFFYNEGWLQASISLLGVIGGAVAGAMLMMTVMQPFGPLAVLCIASASIVAAALTAGLTNVIQAECIQALNTDAMDSADPYRFALTEGESATLEKNGIDPTKVKCAIAALRYEIKELPSLTSRWFGHSPQQEKLQLIRALRRGEKTEMSLNDLRFDLRMDGQPQFVQASNDAHLPSADGVPLTDLELDLKKPALGYTG